MTCRGCGSSDTRTIFSLGDMPLANSLLDGPSQPYKTYPLELALCPVCSLVQLTQTVPPEDLFVDYSYLTSYSIPMVEHAKQLVDEVMSLYSPEFILEIGSNDGYLLQHYLPHSVPTVLGIDPSHIAAQAAKSRNVATIEGFFGSLYANTIVDQVDIIHANNVLAHVPDLNDFVGGIALALKPSGLAIIEVPYLCQLIDKTAFDTCYHEHIFYFSLTALSALFARHNLIINRTDEIPTHGGSLRLWVGKRGAPDPTTLRLLSRESFFIRSSGYYRQFALRVEAAKRDTRELLSHRTVAGFGAAAKATIFLNACGITSAEMPYIADATPTKQGKFIPGTGIQVLPVESWLNDQPDATMILCWNFAHDVAHRYTPAYHGRFFTWYTPEIIQGVSQ